MTPLPGPFRQTSPYMLELREGGGCRVLLGVPFLVAAVFLAWQAMNHSAMRFTFGLMSLPALCAGVLLSLGRRTLTVDLSMGTLSRRHGFFPVQRGERHLTDFNAVVITCESGGSDSPDLYPVTLRATAGRDFLLTRSAAFGESRKQAEYMCRFLNLPIIDATTDHEFVASPSRAGDALRDRLIACKAEPAPARPPAMRCEVVEAAGAVTVVIPGGKRPLAAIAAFIPAAVLLILIPALLRVFRVNRSPLYIQFGFSMFLILMFGIPSILGGVNLMVGSIRKRTTVKASPSGLAMERRTAWRTRTTMLSAADILDLDCSTFEGALASVRRTAASSTFGPGTERLFAALNRWVPTKGIIVKSRDEMIAFGEGLPAGELRYLSWVLRKALAGR